MKLSDAIDSAKARLDAAAKSDAKVPGSAHGYEIVISQEIDNWQFMLICRKQAFNLLAALPAKRYNADGLQKYQVERFLAVQAYLAAHWALCDSITSWVGRALCYGKMAHSATDSLKLPDLEDCIPERLAVSVRDQFGYAIALSYQIRNCFVHDGGAGFFRGPDQQSGLRIHDDQWNNLHETSKEPAKKRTRKRSSFALADTERDLGRVFQCCETEIDDALGTLLVSACALIEGHMGFLAESASA